MCISSGLDGLTQARCRCGSIAFRIQFTKFGNSHIQCDSCGKQYRGSGDSTK